MSEPRVSIITRTFNRQDRLRRALESAAKQTYSNRELVVINDAGCDVQHVLDEIAPLLPNGADDIVYLNFSEDEKPGRSRAASLGIEASSGEWICYLDDDDFYFPNHLEVLMKAAKETDLKILYTDAHHGTEEPVGPNGEYVITTVGPGPSEDFSKAGFFGGCYIHLVTFCHHREIYDTLGGFDQDLPVLEDLDMFFRYANYHHFQHVKEVTAQFQIRTDKTNAVTSMQQEFIETRTFLMKKYMHLVVADLMIIFEGGRDGLKTLMTENESLKARVKRLEDALEDLKANQR